jgi:hypothetical protein
MWVRSLFAVLGALSIPSGSPTEPIDFSATSQVYFSSPSAHDTVTAVLSGADCLGAEFVVTIEQRGGRRFRRAIPMGEILPCDWYQREPDAGRWSAAHIVNRSVAPVRADERDCAGPRSIGCWTSPEFDRLRRANAPLVCFPSGSESGSCVAFDPESKSVVEAMRWAY